MNLNAPAEELLRPRCTMTVPVMTTTTATTTQPAHRTGIANGIRRKTAPAVRFRRLGHLLLLLPRPSSTEHRKTTMTMTTVVTTTTTTTTATPMGCNLHTKPHLPRPPARLFHTPSSRTQQLLRLLLFLRLGQCAQARTPQHHRVMLALTTTSTPLLFHPTMKRAVRDVAVTA